MYTKIALATLAFAVSAQAAPGPSVTAAPAASSARPSAGAFGSTQIIPDGSFSVPVPHGTATSCVLNVVATYNPSATSTATATPSAKGGSGPTRRSKRCTSSIFTSINATGVSTNAAGVINGTGAAFTRSNVTFQQTVDSVVTFYESSHRTSTFMSEPGLSVSVSGAAWPLANSSQFDVFSSHPTVLKSNATGLPIDITYEGPGINKSGEDGVSLIACNVNISGKTFPCQLLPNATINYNDLNTGAAGQAIFPC